MKKIKIFIINLERSKDRKKFMQEQIQKLFMCNPNLKNLLEFEFFRAMETTITQRKKKLNIPSKIIRKITRFYFLTLRFIFTKKYH